VCFRIDFPAWLTTLTPRERQMVREMAGNERTLDLGKRFELSPARISQLRRELHNDWRHFLGDDVS
jgi:DNA-directed RNA polymerase sigma subunit (sigma70/sigma32)